MEQKKRVRQTNFTDREEELLIDLARKYKSVIENKKTDAIMWREKENAWNSLADEFNAEGGHVPRSVCQLKLKYGNMKREVRKKNAALRYQFEDTGRGSITAPKLTLRDEKIKDLVSLSVDGLAAKFDCDVIEDSETALSPNASALASDHNVAINEEIVGVKGNATQEEMAMTDQDLRLQLICSSGSENEEATGGNSSKAAGPSGDNDNNRRYCDPGVSGCLEWGTYNPSNLKTKKSTLLRTKCRRKPQKKTIFNTAGGVQEGSRELQDLQIQCLKQETLMNAKRDRILDLKEEKLRLEIEMIKENFV